MLEQEIARLLGITIAMILSLVLPVLIVWGFVKLFDIHAPTKTFSLHSPRNRKSLEKFEMFFKRERTKEQTWHSN